MADTVPTISAGGSSPQKTTGKTLRKAPKATTKAKSKPAAKGIPTSGARLAAYLADPGLRSKLPDSALTPALLATRQQNTYNAAPAAPGSSYTNKDLNSLLGMLTQQKYGGAELALKQQGTALNNRATTEIPAWFQAYRDQIAGAKTAEQTGAAQQVGSLNEMATRAAGDTGGLAGAPMDAAGAARAQAAAQIRSAGVSNQAALAQNLGANQDAFLQNLGLLSNPQQQAALLQVGSQQNNLAGQVAQLAQDKGDFKTTQRQTILSDEADSALKNALTTAQIGSTNANAAATSASTTKTKTETTKSKSDQAYFDKHGYYPSTGKPTSPDAAPQAQQAAKAGYTSAEWAKMTPEQRRAALAKAKPKSTTDKDQYGNTSRQRQAANDSFTKAQRLANRAIKAKPELKKDPGKLIDFLISENVNPTYAQAAVQAATHDGRVGPKTSKRLKQRGVTKFPKTSPKIGQQTATVVSNATTDIANLLGQL